MRLVFDGMIALMLVGVLAAMVYYYRQNNRHDADYRFVHDSLRRLREQTNYRRAIAMAEDPEATYPTTVDIDWFGEAVPVNVLLPGNQPWMDVAPTGDLANHPPDPIIRESKQAGFWYNPNLGLFRARVMPQMSESRTLEMYNEVNGTSQTTLENSADPARLPQLLTNENGEPLSHRAPTVVVKPDPKDKPPARPTLSQSKAEDERSDKPVAPQRRTLQTKVRAKDN